MTPLASQLVNLFASALLLIAFAMLAQRRIVTLINLFALQGLALVGSTVTVAYATGQTHLYWSAGDHVRAQGRRAAATSCTASSGA